MSPQIKDVVRIDVREQRRNRCPLRNALLQRRPRPLLNDPRGQPLLNQPQDPPIRDPVLQELHQPLMVKAGEVVAEISVEHPVHLLAHDPGSERIQRVMRAAARPEPVREAEKVRFVYGVQHLDQRPLKDLVLQRSDPERPLPPVWLWYVHPPRRPRPVRAPVNPSVKIPKVLLKIDAVVLPRHAIHPRRGLGLQSPICRPQAIDVNVVQERGEPRFLVHCCHSAHTTKRTGRAKPGTESGARFAGRVPLGRSASLHRLRRPALGVVQQLLRYYRTVRLLTIVHHGITASAFPARPAPPITTGG